MRIIAGVSGTSVHPRRIPAPTVTRASAPGTAWISTGSAGTSLKAVFPCITQTTVAATVIPNAVRANTVMSIIARRATDQPLQVMQISIHRVRHRQPAVCPSGTKSCNGECADLTSDSKNCGICGFACPTGFACNSKLCLPSATQICSNFPCPPLTHCEVFNNVPVCVVDPTVCDKMPPCPPLMHCEVKLGAPVCVF